VTSGPLTRADLEALWRDVNDESYWRPLVESPGAPIETVEQSMAQVERVSVAVDRTTQAMYIFQWSGQSDAPASGEALAVVALRVVRASSFDRLVVFEPGLSIAHVTDDYGEDGAKPFATGRRYTPLLRCALLPGDAELTIPAVAERPGTGYNQPQPGTIREFVQTGGGLTNTGRATPEGLFATSTGAGPQLAPGHVGGYVEFLDGPMAGQRRQIRRYAGGSPSVVEFDRYVVFRGATTAGEFVPGERVLAFDVSGAVVSTGTLVAANAMFFAFELDATSAYVAAATVVVGTSSAATFTIESTIQQPAVAGVGAWRFLDWTPDVGVAITNPEPPAGGRAAMLDELGLERNVPRASREPDASYQARVGNPADVVTPNAIRRAANHVLAPYGLACCFRQVGSRLLPGFFYDAGSSANVPQHPAANYAYDMPATSAHRNKVLLDLAHFRGWFRVGVPRLHLGEFGFAYDVGRKNAYDQRLAQSNFFDGFPVGNRAVYAALWAAVERARMGGVRWDLYIEDVGCF
jgi:hypothetical protein